MRITDRQLTAEDYSNLLLVLLHKQGLRGIELTIEDIQACTEADLTLGLTFSETGITLSYHSAQEAELLREEPPTQGMH